MKEIMSMKIIEDDKDDMTIRYALVTGSQSGRMAGKKFIIHRRPNTKMVSCAICGELVPRVKCVQLNKAFNIFVEKKHRGET